MIEGPNSIEYDRGSSTDISGILVARPPAPDFEERGTDAQLTELYAALAAARGEFGEIRRSAEVKIDGKASYKFKYAPMEELLAATVPALSKHGLIVMLPFMRTMDDAAKQLLIIAHRAGARLVFTFPFHAAGDVKIFGGQTTYYQRYMYRSALSLAADADLDEIPDEKKGETSAQASSRPRQVEQKQQAPGKQLDPGAMAKAIIDEAVQTQRTVPVDGAGPKASEQQVEDVKAAARACGYSTLRDLSNRIYGILWSGEVRSLGEPFLFGLSAADADKVIGELTRERSERQSKSQ